jgi:hypothetical protein
MSLLDIVTLIAGGVTISGFVYFVLDKAERRGAVAEKLENRFDDVEKSQRSLATTIEEIKSAVHSNGGNSNSSGDIALRVERAVQLARDDMRTYAGANEEAHREFRRKFGDTNRRVSKLERVS